MNEWRLEPDSETFGDNAASLFRSEPPWILRASADGHWIVRFAEGVPLEPGWAVAYGNEPTQEEAQEAALAAFRILSFGLSLHRAKREPKGKEAAALAVAKEAARMTIEVLASQSVPVALGTIDGNPFFPLPEPMGCDAGHPDISGVRCKGFAGHNGPHHAPGLLWPKAPVPKSWNQWQTKPAGSSDPEPGSSQ